MIHGVNDNILLNNLKKTSNAQITARMASQKTDFDSYIKSETTKPTTPDVYSNQSKEFIDSDDKKKDTKQKKQFVLQVEGNYYCTYLVDSKGNKILINRVPISQIDASATNFEKAKQKAYLSGENNHLNLKQQINSEAAHKVNVQSIMEILKSCVGIPNQIDCKQQLKK